MPLSTLRGARDRPGRLHIEHSLFPDGKRLKS